MNSLINPRVLKVGEFFKNPDSASIWIVAEHLSHSIHGKLWCGHAEKDGPLKEDDYWEVKDLVERVSESDAKSHNQDHPGFIG